MWDKGSVLLGICDPGNCLLGTSERGEECGKGPVFQGIVSKVPLIPGKSSPGYEFLGSVCWRDMETGTCNPGTRVTPIHLSLVAPHLSSSLHPRLLH